MSTTSDLVSFSRKPAFTVQGLTWQQVLAVLQQYEGIPNQILLTRWEQLWQVVLFE